MANAIVQVCVNEKATMVEKFDARGLGVAWEARRTRAP